MATHSQAVLADHVPNEHEVETARQLEKILESLVFDEKPISMDKFLSKVESANIALTPSLARIFIQALKLIGSGAGIRMMPVSEELSTQQAADILNVSRPYLVKILEEGAIPFTSVGRHRRIRMIDLLSFKAQRDSKRDQALADMAEFDAENDHL